MNNKIKISIADSNTNTQKLLSENIKSHDDMKIINISSDGESCLASLKESKPDILVMDLLLPKVAGFEILDYIKSNDAYKDMIIIIMTALTGDSIVHKITDYEVEYILDKPFNPDHLIKKARVLYRMKLAEEADLLKKKIIYDKNYGDITELLINIGLKPHLSGFHYFKTAIYKSAKEITLLNAVTKELYPLVADIYTIEPENVESSMRHVIKLTWKDNKRVKKAMKQYGYKKNTIKRPSNSKFISIICNYLRSNDPDQYLY